MSKLRIVKAGAEHSEGSDSTDPEILEELETLREIVAGGGVETLLFVTGSEGGRLTVGGRYSANHLPLMIGALELLKADLIDAAMEMAE